MPHTEIKLEEIPLDTPHRVEHEALAIVIIRTDAGVTAFEDRCPHAFWPLSSGDIYDGVLECPGHGWEFDISSGRCLNAPAYCLNPVSVTVQADTVRLEWDDAPAGVPALDDAEEDDRVTLPMAGVRGGATCPGMAAARTADRSSS